MAVRSPRASARREMLRRVMTVKERIERLRLWWTCTTTVWERTETGYQRERRLEEYPEAQRRYWAATVGEIEDLIKELREAKAFALAEYQKTEAP